MYASVCPAISVGGAVSVTARDTDAGSAATVGMDPCRPQMYPPAATPSHGAESASRLCHQPAGTAPALFHLPIFSPPCSTSSTRTSDCRQTECLRGKECVTSRGGSYTAGPAGPQ